MLTEKLGAQFLTHTPNTVIDTDIEVNWLHAYCRSMAGRNRKEVWQLMRDRSNGAQLGKVNDYMRAEYTK